ncbi:hypothetical protein JCM33374_g2812 [Metschnikowia sp. JCM 33374]|nr:hypothetical protein JCM33374_g2812 [Metschnikowia sp. JCM 33374]
MVNDKKSHRSLRDIFRGSSPSSPSKLHSQVSLSQSSDGIPSHRSFLRSRDSKGSTSSQSSVSSVKSSSGNLSGAESSPVSPSVTSGQTPSDSESSASFMSIMHHDGKEKLNKKGKKKEQRHESHLSLKRFFKILQPKDHGDLAKSKSSSHLPSSTSKLAEKYDIGRLIGTGASGSVNLINDKNDFSHIYALKKFRNKLKSENEQDYLRKVRNEFLVGEHLRQQNLIHTIELFEEKSDTSSAPEYYIVMEYCPYDFFNLVMSGLMKYDEICCYFRQIVHGVHHLHKSGIAHRDLKLDNCVVDKNGILKLIDFGSAFQFKKSIHEVVPRRHDVMLDDTHVLLLANGIVGSDPYLAPEVFSPASEEGYDARLADVWSIAIIFCCMVLKRFPWKLPRAADPSYRAFAGLNSLNEPLSEQEIMNSMTKELNVSKEAIPKYGPERLLRILPPRSRNLLAYMLKINAHERAFIEDVANDEFFMSIEFCHYEEATENPAKPENPKLLEKPDKLASFQIGDDGSRDSLVDGSIQPTETAGIPSPAAQPLVETKSRDQMKGSSQVVIRARNHKHHLVTEKDLQKINAEKERIKRAKEAGIA